MDQYIQISKINDFIFCPYSLYFHSIYENFDEAIYHSTFQQAGKISHENIDNQVYTTSKDILQGIDIYSAKYNLIGKIDIYDCKNRYLIERKRQVKNIFTGYKYQLYAQYFCLLEMGYKVNKLSIHSLIDNKRYLIPMPDKKEIFKFNSLINKINNFDVSNKYKVNVNKCKNCIYNQLCFIL